MPGLPQCPQPAAGCPRWTPAVRTPGRIQVPLGRSGQRRRRLVFTAGAGRRPWADVDRRRPHRPALSWPWQCPRPTVPSRGSGRTGRLRQHGRTAQQPASAATAAHRHGRALSRRLPVWTPGPLAERRKQRTINPLTAPTRYHFLCSPSRRPAKAAGGGRPRPAGPNRTRDAAKASATPSRSRRRARRTRWEQEGLIAVAAQDVAGHGRPHPIAALAPNVLVLSIRM
jgi:hypothetical protein